MNEIVRISGSTESISNGSAVAFIIALRFEFFSIGTYEDGVKYSNSARVRKSTAKMITTTDTFIPARFLLLVSHFVTTLMVAQTKVVCNV
jgi:hypothetical protein